MFKWICYGTAVAFGCVIVILLGSLTLEADRALTRSNEALATVNESLPQVVDEAKKITHTLAMVSEDVSALRELAGVQPRDKSLVGYANSVLDLLEERMSGGQAVVGLKRTFGPGLKDVESVQEFIVGARREAALLVFRAKSPQEVLHRLSHNWSGKPFYLEPPGTEPVPLHDWLRTNHPPSRDLPLFED